MAGDEAGRSCQLSVPKSRRLLRSQLIFHHRAVTLKPSGADRTAIPWGTWKYDWQESAQAFCLTTSELQSLQPHRKERG